ncbi:MAG TPA: OmpA family protein [Smithella sp.]|nr:OmpA family protein [Smithella sp.]
MKKIGFFAFILMLMTMVASVQAEVRANSVSITPFVGFYDFESNEYDFDNSVTVGLRAGYNFTRNIGVEGFVHFVPTETQVYPIDGDDDVYLYGYGVEGLFHFFPTSTIVPFLAAGIGGIHYQVDGNGAAIDDMNKFAFDYGAGVKFFLPEKVANFFFADDLALRADIRHVIPINETYNDLMTTIGINFAFGGKAKCVDSDNDGVCDDRDKCPDTPADCEVDKDGCPVDSDKDGVIDCKDKCPGTPAGSKVDKDGCCLDSDKDGVDDCKDKCPNTPAGCPVDKDGCPLDSDKDGVIDCKDKCPGTPAGAIVDKDGCMREKITIELKVEFDTDKSVVKDKYREEIKRVADFMKQYPNTKATIEGHTDSRASDAYNLRLSNDRANAVRDYLVKEFGVEASRLNAKGYGESRPIATNDTEEGMQKNRRVWAVLEAVEVK